MAWVTLPDCFNSACDCPSPTGCRTICPFIDATEIWVLNNLGPQPPGCTGCAYAPCRLTYDDTTQSWSGQGLTYGQGAPAFQFLDYEIYCAEQTLTGQHFFNFIRNPISLPQTVTVTTCNPFLARPFDFSETFTAIPPADFLPFYCSFPPTVYATVDLKNGSAIFNGTWPLAQQNDLVWYGTGTNTNGTFYLNFGSTIGPCYLPASTVYTEPVSYGVVISDDLGNEAAAVSSVDYLTCSPLNLLFSNRSTVPPMLPEASDWGTVTIHT